MEHLIFWESIQPKVSIIKSYEDKFDSQELFTLKAPESEFEKKAIQQLQLRSLPLINTKQYAEFDEQISAGGKRLTLDGIVKTFTFFFPDNFLQTKPENENLKNYNDEFLTEFNEQHLFQSQTTPKGNQNQKLDEELSLTQMPSKSSTIDDKNVEDESKVFPIIRINDPTKFDQSLKTELEKLVLIILSNVGKNNKEVLEARNLYAQNDSLLQAYDALVQKYFSSKKVKEDIVRYIIRKVFKMMKKPLKGAEKIKGKKASLFLCKRYFPKQFDHADDADLHKESELLGFLMPYNQNSKNRTMNSNFIQEIFSSEAFLKDYQEFLLHLDFYLQEDNKKKLKKLLDLLIKCIKNNDFKGIGSLKVFPWLDIWIEETRKTAFDLHKNKSCALHKQVKL